MMPGIFYLASVCNCIVAIPSMPSHASGMTSTLSLPLCIIEFSASWFGAPGERIAVLGVARNVMQMRADALR
jgi:hypothetical protein